MWVITLGLIVAIALILLRIYSLIRSITWISAHGTEFLRQIEEVDLEQRNLETYTPIYDRTGGRFFPFGVKSYLLNRAYRRARTQRKLIRACLLFIARRAWILYAFAPIMSLVLFFAASSTVVHLGPTSKWLGFTIGLLLCLCMLIVAAEGAYSTTVFKTWAGPHHRFRHALMADLKIIIGSGLTTWTVATAYYYFIAGQFGGLNKFPGNADWFGRLVLSMRYAWISLVAQNDADPSSTAANAATLVVQITGASYLVILIGLFGGMLLENGRNEFQRQQDRPDNESSQQAEKKPEQIIKNLHARRIRGAMGLATIGYLAWRLSHLV